MLSCTNRDDVKCDPRADPQEPSGLCGSDFAYFYFVSFYSICSFLVRMIVLVAFPFDIKRLYLMMEN